MMKRLIVGVLCMVFVLGIGACNKTKTTEPAGDTGSGGGSGGGGGGSDDGSGGSDGSGDGTGGNGGSGDSGGSGGGGDGSSGEGHGGGGAPRTDACTQEAHAAPALSVPVSLCKTSYLSYYREVDWLVNGVKGGTAATALIAKDPTKDGVAPGRWARITAPKTLPANSKVTASFEKTTCDAAYSTDLTIYPVSYANKTVVASPVAKGASGSRPINSEAEDTSPQQMVFAGTKLCAIWTDNRGGSNDIWSHCSDPLVDSAGKAVVPAAFPGDDVRVNSVTSGNQETPVLTVSPHGVLYATWCGGTSSANKLRFAKSTDGGVSWGAEVSVNENAGFSADATCSHAVAAGPDGAVYVVATGATTDVTSNGNVGLFCSSDGGASFTLVSGKINRAPNDGNNSDSTSYTDIAVDSSKNVHLVWQDSRNSERDIFYDKGTRGHGGCSDLSFTNTDWQVNQRSGVKTSDADMEAALIWVGGVVHVVWRGELQDDQNYRVYYARKADGDAAFSAAVKVDTTVSDNDGYNQKRPHIAVSGDGLIYVSWEDGRTVPGNSNSKPYVAKSCDGGATFTGVTNVNVDAAGAAVASVLVTDITMAVDAKNQVHFFWLDQTNDVLESRATELAAD